MAASAIILFGILALPDIRTFAAKYTFAAKSTFAAEDCVTDQQPLSAEMTKARPLSCSVMPGGLESAPSLSWPSFDSTVQEPLRRMRLTRITDNTSRESSDLHPLRHHYSKRQAWNQDETLIDLGSRIVDAKTYREVLPYEPLSSARNWSSLNPDMLIGIRYREKGNELVTFNVRTEEYDSIHTFDKYDKCSFGQGEGNVTDDDRRVVVTCVSDESGETHIIAFDIAERRVLGMLVAEKNINWASFSPSGDYILVENNKFPDPAPQIIRYDPQLGSPMILLDGKSEHGDFAVNADGDEVYVMLGASDIWYLRLADGLTVSLGKKGRLDALGYGHLSCRAVQRPGWCYLSLAGHKLLGAIRLGTPKPTDSVDRLPRQPSGADNVIVEIWGYHRSSEKNYTAQAKASVSPSGRTIIFTSDWNGQHPVDDYILEADALTPDVGP